MDILEGGSFVITQSLTMGDNSTELYDVRNELRMELIVLNGYLKKLDKDWDFSAVLRPLLEDTGPEFPLLTQIDRLKNREIVLPDLRMTSSAKNRNAKYMNAKNRNNRGPPQRQRRRLQKGAEVVRKDV